MNKTVIIIGGPTAVGKTSVAIELAKHLGTEIISADSRQCYREMKIGVARPSEEELAAVPHHFIATHSIHDKVTAATFETYALQKAEEIFQNRDILVMVGGTGLYLKAFTEGLDHIPEVPESIREEIRSDYASRGLQWLQDQVKQSDPLFYSKGEIQNPQRLMRALEVARGTGQSIYNFRNQLKEPRPFRVIQLALQLPKEVLHRNINHRVDDMVQQGLLQEVESLVPYSHLNALQTVGYRELFAYFRIETSLDQALEEIKKNTRLYAKRQMTWFRNHPGFHLFEPDPRNILSHLNGELS